MHTYYLVSNIIEKLFAEIVLSNKTECRLLMNKKSYFVLINKVFFDSVNRSLEII